MRRSRPALLTALGVDNFGSGLFLPVVLFTAAVWLPWLLVGATAGLAVLATGWLGGQLPARVLRPESVRPGDEARPSAAAA
jgi:hypothetical protein